MFVLYFFVRPLQAPRQQQRQGELPLPLRSASASTLRSPRRLRRPDGSGQLRPSRSPKPPLRLRGALPGPRLVRPQRPQQPVPGREEHQPPMGGPAVQEGRRRRRHGVRPAAARGGRDREEVGGVRAPAAEGDELQASDERAAGGRPVGQRGAAEGGSVWALLFFPNLQNEKPKCKLTLHRLG